MPPHASTAAFDSQVCFLQAILLGILVLCLLLPL